MKNNVIAIAMLAFLCSSFPAYSVMLASQSEIVQITNTSNNADVFTIWIDGGTGICTSGNKQISFKSSSTPHPDVFKRASSAGLTGVTAGVRVQRNNYTTGSADPCLDAVYIRLIK